MLVLFIVHGTQVNKLVEIYKSQPCDITFKKNGIFTKV
jgi:hypothetical protein